MTVRGGFESNDLLKHINFETIESAEKILFGFSDTSVLLNAMSLRIPKGKFIHGPNLMTFAQIGKRDITFDRFVMALNGQYDISPINFYGNYSDAGNTQLVATNGVVALQEGVAEGKIWGGNLSSIQLLLGTPYMPQEERDIILFIEEDELCGDDAPQMFKRALHHLAQQKIPLQVKGIILGQFEVGSNITPNFIKACLKDTGIFTNTPAAMNFMFGHTVPAGCFPIGGYCYLNITSSNSSVKIKDKK